MNHGNLKKIILFCLCLAVSLSVLGLFYFIPSPVERNAKIEGRQLLSSNLELQAELDSDYDQQDPRGLANSIEHFQYYTWLKDVESSNEAELDNLADIVLESQNARTETRLYVFVLAALFLFLSALFFVMLFVTRDPVLPPPKV